MELYPTIRINAPDYRPKRSDGRVTSNAEDGTPRSQILYPKMLHTFTVQHFLLDEGEREIVEGFYQRNRARHFLYECDFNKKQYVCTFLDAPQQSEHVGRMCNITAVFSGFEHAT